MIVVAAPEPETKKSKRVATSAQKSASRANGLKSKGPVSTCGKDRSKYNGISHGMCCRNIVFLEGESPEEFWLEVNRLAAQQSAVGEAEYSQVETIVYSRWRMRRAQNADATAVNEVGDKIKDDYADWSLAAVRALIPLLQESPETTVEQLKNSSKGCAYLIEQWGFAHARLRVNTTFEVSQRTVVVQLAGYRPSELFRNSAVRDWTRAYFGAIKGPDGFTAAGAANALMHDRPPEMSEEEFERRLAPIVTDLPTVMEGHALLLQYVDKELAVLRDRFELMEFREARARDAAIMTAKADITADGEKRTRYYNSATRTEHAAYRELRALQEVRRKYGLADFEEPARPDGGGAEGAQGEAGAASGPASSESFAEVGMEGLDDAEGPEASVPDEAGAPDTLSMTGQIKSEPGAPQVVDGSEGGALDPRVAAITFERPAHISEELHDELVATYREIIQRSLLHKRD